MSSIGNDIIALRTVDVSRTQNPRFYSKILSPAEQQLYMDSCTTMLFHHFIWLLWSVKESVYKCLQRYQPELIFSPVKMEVVQIDLPEKSFAAFFAAIEQNGFDYDNSFKSIVKFNSQTLYARSIIYGDELIHTVTLMQDNFEDVKWGIKIIQQTDPKNQSAEVRLFLLDRLKIAYPDAELSIQKSASGSPFILSNGLAIPTPVSLSHHEVYVGYAMLMPTSSPA